MPLNQPGAPFAALPLSQFELPAHTEFDPFAGLFPQGEMTGKLLSFALSAFFGEDFMQKYGMIALGGGQGNVFRNMQLMQQKHWREQALARFMPAQTAEYRRFITGVAHLFGADVSSGEVQRAINSMVSGLKMVSPQLVTMMPEVLDTMSGLRGSPGVMLDRMLGAGRFRLDPVTGQPGMTLQSLTRLQESVYEQLFARQNYLDRQMTAGQAGALFEFLQRQALLPAARLEDLGLDTLRAKTEQLNLNPQERDRLGRAQSARELVRTLGELRPDGERALRQAATQELQALDARIVTDNLKSYEKALSAIREIFGDAGHPNAPMPQLIKALQGLTGMQLNQLDADQVAHSLRTAAALGRAAGVSAQGVLLQQSAAAMMAMQLGLPSMVGLQAAEGSLAMRAGLVQSGALGHRVWGLSDIDKQTEKDLQLRIAAADSAMANRLGGLMRMAEVSPDRIKQGSQAARLIEQVRRGESVDFIDQRQFQQILEEGTNLSRAEISELLSQREANEEYIAKYQLGNLVRGRAQGQEWERVLSNSLGFSLRSRLGSLVSGLDQEQLAGISQEAAQAVAQSIRNMPMQIAADPKERNRFIGRAIIQALRGSQHQEARRILAGMGQSDEEQEKWAARAAELLYGQAAEETRQRYGMSLADMQIQHGRESLRHADRQRMAAQLQSEMEQAFAGLSRGTPMQRGLEAVLKYTGEDRGGLAKVFLEAAGVVGRQDVANVLQKQLAQLHEAHSQAQALQKELLEREDLTPEQRADLHQRYRDQLEIVQRQSRQILDFTERQNLLLNSPVSSEQMDLLLRRQKELSLELSNKQANPDKLSAMYRRERATMLAIESRILNHPNAGEVLDESRLGQIRDLRAKYQRLEGMAERFAGGDIGKLLAGKVDTRLSEEQQKQISQEARQLYQDIGGASQNLHKELSRQATYTWMAAEDRKMLMGLKDRIAATLGETAPGAMFSELLSMSDDDLKALREQMREKGQAISDDEWKVLQASRERQKKLKAEAEKLRDESPAEWLDRALGSALGIKLTEEVRKSPHHQALLQILEQEEGAAGSLESLLEDVAIVSKKLQGAPGGLQTNLTKLAERKFRATAKEIAAAERLQRMEIGTDLLELRERAQSNLIGPEEAMSVLNQILAKHAQGDFRKLSPERSGGEDSRTYQIGRLTVESSGGGTLQLSNPASGSPTVGR